MVQAALQLLLPDRCAGCRRLGDLFCPACVETVVAPSPACRRCGAELAAARADCGCRSRLPHLRRLRAAGRYEGPLERALRAYKFGGRRRLATPLAALMAMRLVVEGLPADLVAHVPLHPDRRRRRGYDQAGLLAAELARLTGLPTMPPGLRRVLFTRPQVGLDRPSRRQNVEGAFTWSGPPPPARAVLLVDDVATTGATLNAAASALRRAGGGPVFGLAVARAVI